MKKMYNMLINIQKRLGMFIYPVTIESFNNFLRGYQGAREYYLFDDKYPPFILYKEWLELMKYSPKAYEDIHFFLNKIEEFIAIDKKKIYEKTLENNRRTFIIEYHKNMSKYLIVINHVNQIEYETHGKDVEQLKKIIEYNFE